MTSPTLTFSLSRACLHGSFNQIKPNEFSYKYDKKKKSKWKKLLPRPFWALQLLHNNLAKTCAGNALQEKCIILEDKRTLQLSNHLNTNSLLSQGPMHRLLLHKINWINLYLPLPKSIFSGKSLSKTSFKTSNAMFLREMLTSRSVKIKRVN